MEYVIQKGDTLSALAKRYNTTVKELASVNSIANPNLIRTGRTLEIPDGIEEIDVEPTMPAPAQIAGQAADPYAGLIAALNQLTLPTYQKPDYSSYYDQIAASYAGSLQAANASRQATSDAKAQQLQKEYAEARRQAYVNARLSAIGNNEYLASLGLAGSLYDRDKSGVSESVRAALDMALSGNIAQLTRQEQGQRDTLALEILQAGYTSDVEYAKWMADLRMQQLKQEQADAERQYTSQMQQYQNQVSLLQTLYGLGADRQKYQDSQAQQAFENQLALQKLQQAAAQTTQTQTGKSRSTGAKAQPVTVVPMPKARVTK